MRESDGSDGQDKHTFFRAGTRYFCVDSQWYFSTREGDVGPFPTEEQAARQLKLYIDLEAIKSSKRETVEVLRDNKVVVDPQIWGKQIDIL